MLTWSPVTESNRRPSPYHACRLAGSDYRRSMPLRCLSTSRPVCRGLAALSLGLSLTPGPRELASLKANPVSSTVRFSGEPWPTAWHGAERRDRARSTLRRPARRSRPTGRTARIRQEGRPHRGREPEHHPVRNRRIANQDPSVEDSHLHAAISVRCPALSPCDARFLVVGHWPPSPAAWRDRRRYWQPRKHLECLAGLRERRRRCVDMTQNATDNSSPWSVSQTG
jgi:hypothetical protein